MTPSPDLPPVIVSAPPISRWRWAIHLFLITGYLVVIAFVGFGRSEHAGSEPALSDTAGGLLKVCALEVLSFGVVFAIACAASRPSIDDLRLRWRKNFIPVLLGAGYSVALRVAVGLITAFVAMILVAAKVVTMDKLQHFAEQNRPAIEKTVDVASMRDNPAYFILTLTLVSFVVAGLREELWRSSFLAGMKGVWPRQFSSMSGQIVAVLICAVIFGAGHIAMGVIAVALAGLLGIGLGLIMVFHKSIWPAVIAHGFFDATTMALIPWLMDVLRHLPKVLN